MTSPAQSAGAVQQATLWSSPRFRRWFFVVAAIALAIWGLTDVRRRAQADPEKPWLHKTDFTCYTVAGAAFFDGRNPYEVTNLRGWGYPYPPLLAILVSPLAPLDTQVQGLIWFAISVLFCYGSYREGRRLLIHFLGDSADVEFPSWIGWLALATVSLPVLNCLQRGQVGILKAYFLLAGLRLIVERRSWWRSIAGGVLLALPIAVKVTPILPVSVLLISEWVRSLVHWRSDPRWDRSIGATSGVGLGLALFFLMVPAAFIGWEANLRHLDTWYHEVVTRVNDLNDADRTGNTRTVRNQSLSNAVYRLGNFIAYQMAAGPDDLLADQEDRADHALPMDAPLVERVLFGVRVGLMGLLLLAATCAAWRGDELAQAALFGLATAATLIVAPIGRGHYFMLLLPALLLVPAWLWLRHRPRVALAIAIVPVVLVVTHYLAIDVTGRLGVLGIGTALWYVAALAPFIFIRWPIAPTDTPDLRLPHDGRARKAA